MNNLLLKFKHRWNKHYLQGAHKDIQIKPILRTRPIDFSLLIFLHRYIMIKKTLSVGFL